MRRGVLLLVTWLIGSLAATTLAWAAVGVVRRNVTDRRVAPLSARAVSEALDAAPDTDPNATSTTVTTSASDTSPTTVTSADGRSSGSTTTTTRRGQRPAGGTPTTTSVSGGSSGSSSGGSSSGSGSGSSASTTSTTASPVHPFSIVRADGTVIGQGSFSCNGELVEDRFAAPAQGWNGPHTYSLSTPQRWDFEIDSNSGGRKTEVIVSCPGGSSRVDEKDLDNNP